MLIQTLYIICYKSQRKNAKHVTKGYNIFNDERYSNIKKHFTLSDVCDMLDFITRQRELGYPRIEISFTTSSLLNTCSLYKNSIEITSITKALRTIINTICTIDTNYTIPNDIMENPNIQYYIKKFYSTQYTNV